MEGEWSEVEKQWWWLGRQRNKEELVVQQLEERVVQQLEEPAVVEEELDG